MSEESAAEVERLPQNPQTEMEFSKEEVQNLVENENLTNGLQTKAESFDELTIPSEAQLIIQDQEKFKKERHVQADTPQNASGHTDLSRVEGNFYGDSKPQIQTKKNQKVRKKNETKLYKSQKQNKKTRKKARLKGSLGVRLRCSNTAPRNSLDGSSIYYKHTKKKEKNIRTGRWRPKPPFQGTGRTSKGFACLCLLI